jgi:hypothetical protein
MDLQPLDLLLDRLDCREQRRHRDEGAKIGGNTIAKLQSGQQRRAEPARDAAIHQGDRSIDGRDHAQGTEQNQPCPVEPGRSKHV